MRLGDVHHGQRDARHAAEHRGGPEAALAGGLGTERAVQAQYAAHLLHAAETALGIHEVGNAIGAGVEKAAGNALGKVPVIYGRTVETAEEESPSILERLLGGRQK